MYRKRSMVAVLYWRCERLNIFSEHEKDGTLDLFSERIANHNHKRGSMIEAAENGRILGSLGAVDCTYSITSRLGKAAYETMNGIENSEYPSDMMFSQYIRAHAWKLSIITSNGTKDYFKCRCT